MTLARRIRFALVATALFGAAPALAQTSTTKPPSQKGQDKPQVIQIDDGDEIEGGRVGPEGSDVTVAKPRKVPSFIKLRSEFLREMLKSAEGI